MWPIDGAFLEALSSLRFATTNDHTMKRHGSLSGLRGKYHLQVPG